MAQRLKQIDLNDEPLNDDSPSEMALSETLAQLGSEDIEAKVWCYKFDPKTNQRGYLFTCSPEEFRIDGLDRLRDQYGGGDYNVRVYGAGRGLLTNQKLTIVASAHSTPVNAQAAPLAGIKDLIAESNTNLATALSAGLQAIAQAMQMLQQQKTPSLTEMIAALHGLNQMTPKPASVENPFGMFKSMIEAFREMQGILPNGDSNNDPLLSTFSRVIEPMLTRAMQAENAAVPLAPSEAAPVALVQNSQLSSNPSTLSKEAEMRILIKQFITMLVSNARQNNPVETYAEMLIDNAPEPLLRQLVSDSDYLEKLAVYDPDVKLFPQWFERLRTETGLILTEMEKPDTHARVKKVVKAHAPGKSGKAEH